MSSRHEKLVVRFVTFPRDFRWHELVRLLEGLGYKMRKPGKTSGSRRTFVHEEFGVIPVHKPHPGNIIKPYAMRKVFNLLKERGQI